MSEQTSSTHEATGEPTPALAALAKVILGKESLDAILYRVAQLAKMTIPGIAEVSVTLVAGDHANTAAFTGELAQQLDERQYEQGYGPCLDAAQAGATVLIEDMVAESRWPRFTPLAADLGVRSSLSVGLPVQQEVIGALNLYAMRTQTFDPAAANSARTFAGYAAVALANASIYTSTAELAAQMQAAMESRATIEQAKGIIMAQLRCDAQAAFDVLTKRSQHANRKLRDIAAEIVAIATDHQGK
jgi:transcriptional regulator with GAF, ATPase, and Fis domain